MTQDNCQQTNEWLSQVWNCSLKEDNHLNPAQEWTVVEEQEKLHLCRSLLARLKYARENLEKDYACWKCALWSDKTKLEVSSHRTAAYVGEVYDM